MLKINLDQNRFDEKIKKLKKEGLERYFSRGLFSFPRTDGKLLQIPIRSLQLPRFKFNESELEEIGDVGQGNGDIGDIVKDADRHDGADPGGHGSGSAEHDYAEIQLEEAARLLEEQLELPNLLEKFLGNLRLKTKKEYKKIQPYGPESLRHLKRTFRRALLRTIASGEYDPSNPKITIIGNDKRYKSPKEEYLPITKAAVFWLLDCSGSMENVIDFLQNVGFWSDAWIRKHYKTVENRYVHYDHAACEVSFSDFYSVISGGGTSMRSGLDFSKKIIKSDYPENEFNIYLFHFTDGDCYGLEVSEQEAESYRAMAQEYPDLAEEEGFENLFENFEAGNPLINFFIPRCSAIFVCEAGGYYGNFKFEGHEEEGNYSNLLGKLVEARPALNKKLRFVSYKEEEIEQERGQKIKDTLIHWFK